MQRKSVEQLKLSGTYRPGAHGKREAEEAVTNLDVVALKKDARNLKKKIGQLDAELERDGLILTDPRGRKYAHPANRLLEIAKRELSRIDVLLNMIKPTKKEPSLSERLGLR
jgi:ABC-type phosphate transport system auxiliary subunit